MIGQGLALLFVLGGWLAFLALAVAAVAGLRRLRAWIWHGNLPHALGALPVDDVEAPDAPRGWKCAQILLSPDGEHARLAGITVGGTYGVEDRAVCVQGHDHTVPSLACDCGFYAYTRREHAVELLGRRTAPAGTAAVRTLLEVDLAGTVVEHERGYRSGEQSVLGVGVLPWCADCAERGVLTAATGMGTDGRPALAIPPLLLNGRAPPEHLHPTVRPLRSWSPLRPLCAGCTAREGLDGRRLSRSEIAARLGTEVTWLDPGLLDGSRILATTRPPRRRAR